jgi:hypothetical protein
MMVAKPPTTSVEASLLVFVGADPELVPELPGLVVPEPAVGLTVPVDVPVVAPDEAALVEEGDPGAVTLARAA